MSEEYRVVPQILMLEQSLDIEREKLKYVNYIRSIIEHHRNAKTIEYLECESKLNRINKNIALYESYFKKNASHQHENEYKTQKTQYQNLVLQQSEIQRQLTQLDPTGKNKQQLRTFILTYLENNLDENCVRKLAGASHYTAHYRCMEVCYCVRMKKYMESYTYWEQRLFPIEHDNTIPGMIRLFCDIENDVNKSFDKINYSIEAHINAMKIINIFTEYFEKIYLEKNIPDIFFRPITMFDNLSTISPQQLISMCIEMYNSLYFVTCRETQRPVKFKHTNGYDCSVQITKKSPSMCKCKCSTFDFSSHRVANFLRSNISFSTEKHHNIRFIYKQHEAPIGNIEVLTSVCSKEKNDYFSMLEKLNNDLSFTLSNELKHDLTLSLELKHEFIDESKQPFIGNLVFNEKKYKHMVYSVGYSIGIKLNKLKNGLTKLSKRKS
jgi:hypothetical protein